MKHLLLALLTATTLTGCSTPQLTIDTLVRGLNPNIALRERCAAGVYLSPPKKAQCERWGYK